ncbi:MAG: DEAD/DEAH box helicase, partial [Candidatus Xenobia bacterium]
MSVATLPLDRLSEAELLVLEIVAVAGYGVEETTLQNVAQSLGGEYVDCRAVAGELKARGWVIQQPYVGYLMRDPRLLEMAVRRAARAGRLDRIDHLLSRFTTMSHWRPGSGERAVRLAAYRGNFDEARRLAQRFQLHLDSSLASIFGEPFEVAWFETLPADLQQSVMLHILAQSAACFVPQTEAWKWFEAHGNRAVGAVVFYSAQQLLYRNRMADLEALIAGGTSGWARSLYAVLAFLDGQDEAADAQFKEAVLRYRQFHGTRKGLLGDFTSIFYLLALLRQRRHAEVVTLAGSVSKGDPEHTAAALLADVARRETGTGSRDVPADWDVRPRNRLTHFVYLLHSFWTDPESVDRDWLQAFHDDAAAADYAFWVEQAAALQARLDGAPPGHALVDVLRRSEPWERILTGLEAVADKLKPAEKGSRLAWTLAYMNEERFELTAVEQKQDRSGWNKGKRVGLKTLSEKAATLPFLTAQDRQIGAAIEKRGTAHDWDYVKALPALVGHPFVFDRAGTLVEVVAATPQLSIARHGDGLRLTLHPLPHGRIVRLLQETPTRFQVVTFNAEHQKLAELLARGVDVPLSAAERLARIGTSVSQILTVHSDLHLGVGAVEVPWDRTLRAVLVPWGLGLKAQMVVQPLGPEGPSFKPGHGGEVVVAEVGGRRVQTRRDLKDERTRLEALLQRSEVLAGGEVEWVIEDVHQCLQLLEELAASDEVEVQWPQGQRFKLAGQASSQSLSLRIAHSKDWFVLDGRVQIDATRVIAMGELLHQVRDGRFVRLGGDEYLALTEEFRRRILALGSQVEEYRGTLRIHALGAAAIEPLTAGVGEVTADVAWEKQVRRMAKLASWMPAVPSTVEAELRPYQVEGYQWLSRLAAWGVGACLADDMGLGKTLQSLAVIVERAPQGPTLVIAPASVGPNWVEEARRFAPTLRVRLYSEEERSGPLTDLQPFDMVVCTYGLLLQDRDRLAEVTWTTIVLDEAQAIKNHGTARSQAAKGLQGGFRLVTTGTPVENHLGELWNLFDFLNPGLLGSWESFHRRFATPITRSAAPEARAALKRLIAPFMLRRTKTQVLSDLPPRIERVVHVELSPDERALYESMRAEAVRRLMLDKKQKKEKENQIKILAELMKLRRACCHPRLVLPSAPLDSSKLSAFGEMVEELLENRHRALVFSQFVDHLAIVREYLDGREIRYQYLDGSTPVPARRKAVDAFQAGEGDLFLISLRAGGTGLNLTAADYVIHLDPWWNPAVEDQASDRAHRIGQTRPVTIYRLVARGTIEEQIVALHTEKRELADSILEGTELSARL